MGDYTQGRVRDQDSGDRFFGRRLYSLKWAFKYFFYFFIANSSKKGKKCSRNGGIGKRRREEGLGEWDISTRLILWVRSA